MPTYLYQKIGFDMRQLYTGGLCYDPIEVHPDMNILRKRASEVFKSADAPINAMYSLMR